MKILNSKIESKEIICALSKLTGNEVWNATYQEAIDELSKNGFYVSAEPFETRSTKNHVEWCPTFARIVENGDGTCSVYHYDGMDSYKTWDSAMDSAILSALIECVGQRDRKIVCVPEESVSPVEKEKHCAKDPKHADRHSIEHPYYARHSEDDPYPYE